VMNYANPDMIGHTGSFQSAVEALRFLDVQIERVVNTTLAAGGAVLLTGDHGNAEEMVNPQTGAVITDHSSNPVLLMYITPTNRQDPPKAPDIIDQILGNPIGVLADVGPTLLDAVGLRPPPEMTAQSLLASLV